MLQIVEKFGTPTSGKQDEKVSSRTFQPRRVKTTAIYMTHPVSGKEIGRRRELEAGWFGL